MGLMVTLQHVTKLADGRYRFRRRFPVDVREGVGWEFIRTSDAPLSDVRLLRWHSEQQAEFGKLVAGQRALTGDPTGTPMELHKASRDRALALLEGVKGIDEDEARSILAEMTVAKYPEDPESGSRIGLSRVDAAMVNALMNPSAKSPLPTIDDAKRLYLQEKVGDPSTERGRKNRNDVDRVFRLMKEALGERARRPLTVWTDADAREVRDHMMQRTKAGAGGAMVKPSSVRRELNVLASVWKVALKGFDLNKGMQAVNIFAGMNIPQEGNWSEKDGRDPLPHPVIAAMWHKLLHAQERRGGTLPQLRLIWRMLSGTGCRVSEIAGLRIKDVSLAGSYPHIRVSWHEERRVKNRASIRSVPLFGDSLEAAEEAIALAEKGAGLFPRYYGTGGGSRLSAALMKHLEVVRQGDEPAKQVVHSLRHNMADWLRLSRVETRTENLILGHALGGVGSRVYGGSPADLELMTEAIKAAHARAEQDMGTSIAGLPLHGN